MLRQELASAHQDLQAWRRQLLDGAGQQWDADHLRKAALCAHAVCAEDATVHLILKGAQPLFTKPEHQMAVLQRQVGSDAFADYMRDVFAAAEAYVHELAPEALQAPLDLSDLGLGKHRVSWVVRRFIVLELASACSETLS